MPSFNYLAVDVAGRRVRGALDAASEIDLELRLKRLGLDLITSKRARRVTRLLARRPVSRPELIDFCFTLEQTCRCGIPLLDALKDMRAQPISARLRDVVANIAERIQSGQMLSQCLAAHPQVFSPVFVSLVRAGEQTGRLAEVFASLAASLRWQDELASQTARLLIYPAVVLIVISSVVALLLTFLIPQVATLLRTMAITLPVQTRVLLAISDTLAAHWPVVVALPVATVACGMLAMRQSPRAAFVMDILVLRVPWIGPILKKIILARFASFFALMYESGIAILEALKTSEGIVHNRCIAQGMARAGQHVAAGATLTESLRVLGMFPPLVIRMVHTGETTGALDLALRNVNYFYTRDVRESVDRALKLLEPGLTLMLGVVLALIMWCTLSPLYDVIGRLKL